MNLGGPGSHSPLPHPLELVLPQPWTDRGLFSGVAGPVVQILSDPCTLAVCIQTLVSIPLGNLLINSMASSFIERREGV